MNEAVHRTHCCKIHGCEYNEPDCPVVNEIIKQAWPCEKCEMNIVDDDLIRVENEEDLAEEENRRWSANTPEGF